MQELVLTLPDKKKTRLQLCSFQMIEFQVQELRNNPQAQEMQTIDGMVAYDVRRSVWAEVLYEDVYVVGRKIESAIFDELIQDLVACAGGFHVVKPS